MLKTINRSALVMYSVEQMYDLVNDVKSYPEYMDGCVGAEIIECTDNHMLARLDLMKSGISISFTTRNSLRPPHAISMQLENGPFQRLEGEWTFKPLTETACKIMLMLEFETSSITTSLASTNLFAKVSHRMVDTLCQRAELRYGKAS